MGHPLFAVLSGEILLFPLSSYNLEVSEVDLLFLAALVGDAQFGRCHAAKFVTCVDYWVIVGVVQQRNLCPCTVDKEFKLEVLCDTVDTEVEVHALICNGRLALKEEFSAGLSVDYLKRRSDFYNIAVEFHWQKRQLCDG